jgi:peptide deformylase
MGRPILKYGAEVLNKVADPVENITGDEVKLVADMVEAMYRAPGVGLAAPQVGLNKRLLVAMQMTSPDDSDAPPIVMVNPEIMSRSRETWIFEEGCLSIPGIRGDVTRPDRIEVRFQDVEGVAHELVAEGMFARVLQHEIDHLDGRLFVDYLSPAEKALLKPKLKKIAERLVD